MEAVVARAGVTRGALYHHFANKQALFEAVLEQLSDEIDREVLASATDVRRDHDDLLSAFVAGIDAFLDACLRPEVRRILLVDGPAVLGWEAWSTIDARHALAQIEAGLAALMEAGLLSPQPVKPLAHLLHGAIAEAARFVVNADNPQNAKQEIQASLRHLLTALVQRDGHER